MINFILSLNIDGIVKQFENCGQFSTNSVVSFKYIQVFIKYICTSQEHHALKSVNNCLKTNIYFY